MNLGKNWIMNKPKISIVLPTYNGEQYIVESLDSIRNQSMRDFECIIVDDSSTDKTYEIVSDFAKNDERFKVIRNNTNQQLPMALNIGFRNADGDYLTWTSDDNRYLKDALSEMSTYLDSHPDTMMVCANMLNIDENGRVLGENEKYDEKTMMLGNTVGACFMYRRKVLEELGGYDDSFRLAEDYEYWMRILKTYGKIGHLDKILYLYRQHKNSLTGTRIIEIKKKHCELLIHYMDWIISKQKNDASVLIGLYEILYMHDSLNESAKHRLVEALPELVGMENADSDKQLILYGAGRVCDAVLKSIPQEKVSYIVDKRLGVGNVQKEGIPIISLEKLKEIHDDYQLVICVARKTQYEVMKDLINIGITKFCLYSCYLKNRNATDVI